MDRPGYESDRYHIEIYDTTTSSFRKVANNWDRSVDSMIWTRNGESLLVTAQEDGHTKLFLVNVQTENVKVLVGNHTNHGVTTVPNSNTVLLQRTSYKFPDDIWRFELISDKVVDLKQITNENPHLSEFHLSNPERFIFKGANDDLVHSWIFKPIGWKPGQKYPMITLIHGGPQGAWNDGWSYRWNPQLFVSHGYAVTAINFHGSTGFGQAFTDSVVSN
jgi:dipeptidyl aminopeptidase/acylaminoacyl peptidase